MRRTEICFAERLAVVALTLGLSACALGGRSPLPEPKPFVSPQVAYRIDDHRYFEITPEKRCHYDTLYFVDTAKGIRSEVVNFDPVMNRTTLIIDAANDQYLIGPVTRGNTNCSSGGGTCGGDKMPYSTDGGRTWKRVPAYSSRNGVMVSGSTAYNVDGAELLQGLDLTLSKSNSNDWKYFPNFTFKPRVAPLDTKVMCELKLTGGQR